MPDALVVQRVEHTTNKLNKCTSRDMRANRAEALLDVRSLLIHTTFLHFYVEEC